MPDTILDDVSDTALWVAVYRARETQRPDALFRDPLAAKLAGERGKRIEGQMSDSRYVSWSIVIRTCIIDSFIQELTAGHGIDTVINLGAGLDTRPYRMKLPAELRWIEIDFPKIIALKEEKLASERAGCVLERIPLDLSRRDERRRVFSELASRSAKILILTEGVTPYLSNDAVASLAEDLRAQPSFRFWITDYNSPDLVKYLNRPRKRKEMRNAPFLFNPSDWAGFYAEKGWRAREMRYIGEESEKLGRKPPHSWWVKIIQALFLSEESKSRFKRYNGYAVLEPKS